MADIELALSEKTAQQVFNTLKARIKDSRSGSKDMGALSVKWDVGFRLENGKIDFQNNNTVRIRELDVVYDPLKLEIGFDIPEVCVGGQCIVPSPWGCVVRLPKKCFFKSDPDIKLPLNLSGIVRSEISTTCGVRTEYFDDPQNNALNVWTAHAMGIPNKWRFFLNPGWFDIDVIDIADTVGTIMDKLIDAAVDALLGWLPGWAQDLVKAILGSFSKLIRKILDIGDDIDEWLSNLLGVSLGIFDLIVQLVAEHFAKLYPIFEFEDPYPIMPAEAGPNGAQLVSVLLRILDPKVVVTDPELTISASVGV